MTSRSDRERSAAPQIAPPRSVAGASGAPRPPAHVRGMFDRIAPTYDRANHILSLSVDRYWRWRTVRLMRPLLSSPAPRVLDICCGTGDFALALLGGLPGARIAGADFSGAMLDRAREKSSALSWLQADAMRLPYPDGSLDAIASAFGFRNLPDYRAALAEFHRCLRPGGVLAILEISRPVVPLLRQLYPFYFERVLPLLGGWISGQPSAYRYLPDSVSRFPSPPLLVAWMKDCGFTSARFHRFAGGIAALHLAVK
ncbi:MAG: bifunctional demethylmenaquinone methyltransferase/2-methoxy-6-polyprenyl-1,4-benzoquinol methylase UbiE [Terriglobales bacterium]